ncbi:MAG: hypothetical protein JWQ02_4626 [Capsulimonas sp.]|nr:hypothetical protein [Capsulimonas sp.]
MRKDDRRSNRIKAIAAWAFVIIMPIVFLTAKPDPVVVPTIDNATFLSGRHVFRANVCRACHYLKGADPVADANPRYRPEYLYGPDLTHEGSRNPEIGWQKLNLTKHDMLFPNGSMGDQSRLMTKAEINDLAAYMASRK